MLMAYVEGRQISSPLSRSIMLCKWLKNWPGFTPWMEAAGPVFPARVG